MLVYLVLGLFLFLSVHTTGLLAEDWRTRAVARFGERRWKGVYSVLSLLGFALVVWGYGVARQQPVQLWAPMPGMRHLAALLTWLAFVLLAATYVPRNHFKARLHHPMLLATKIWALAHLLANGTLAGTILFGSFLLWAVLMFVGARRRDRRLAVPAVPGMLGRSVLTLLVGSLAWAAFAFWLHGSLIGIRPLG
jgi:uncharacterized membrane protein